MPITPVPKPARAPRLLAKQGQRKVQAATRDKKNARERIANYGTTEETRGQAAAFRKRIRERDGNRCILPHCETPRLGLEVHHWPRTVGAGQKNEEWACVTLCASHHDAVHAGRLAKRWIAVRLFELHKYPECSAWLEGESV